MRWGKKVDGKIQGSLKDTIVTPVGKVILSPTLHYGPQWNDQDLFISKSSVNGETGSSAAGLKATLASKDNSIVKLEVINSNINRAEDFLNTLIVMYQENWLLEKNKFAESTSNFLSLRLPEIKKEIDEIEVQLERFKSQNLLTNIQSVGSIYLNQSVNFTGRIIDVRTQISIAQFIREHLNTYNDITTYMPYNSGLNNMAIESQIKEYNTLLMDRDALIANSSESNPVVADRNSKLQVLRQTISQAVDNQIVNLNMQLSGLQTQEARMTQQISSNPVQERKLLELERERKAKLEMFDYLSKKQEENVMSLVLEANNTRIISPPTGSNTPVSPKKMMIYLVAFIFGVGIPGGVIWGKENLNTKVSSKSDVESLSVPFLGVIALADNQEQNTKISLLVSESGRDTLNETFRMVRTSMNTTCGKDKKVVMFTSFEPGCGKTFVALNLAMSFALAGKKIALIDVDLRTAALSLSDKSGNNSENPEYCSDLGYCDFLNKRVSWRQLYMFHTWKNRYYKNFDIFPVGAIPQNPTELLESDQLNKMIEHLKNKYDYVFMDCTPLDVVTDATIVSKHADLTVFIVREDHTDRRKLRELEKISKQQMFNNLNIILNGSKVKIAFNKYHTRYNKKADTVYKQIRASERIIELQKKEPKTKLLPEASTDLQKV